MIGVHLAPAGVQGVWAMCMLGGGGERGEQMSGGTGQGGWEGQHAPHVIWMSMKSLALNSHPLAAACTASSHREALEVGLGRKRKPDGAGPGPASTSAAAGAGAGSSSGPQRPGAGAGAGAAARAGPGAKKQKKSMLDSMLGGSSGSGSSGSSSDDGSGEEEGGSGQG